MMGKIFFFLSLAIVVSLVDGKSDRCGTTFSSTSGEVDKECTSSEYTSYVDCIRKRSKRTIDCNNGCEDGGECGYSEECGQCDCNYCSYNDCDANCSACCSSYQPPCETRTCCHATCQSTCRTSSCRRNCRSRCHKSIEKVTTHTSGSYSGSSQAQTNLTSSNQARHNITTVINLKTVVNNTNIVDMPVRVNNTNVNNITLEAPQPGDISVNMHSEPGQTIVQPPPYPPYPPYPPHPEQPPQQPHVTPEHPVYPTYPQYPCCNVISPRQCVMTQEPPYQNCYHTKTKVCSDVCLSAVMHAEPHRVCDNQVTTGHHSNCHEQVAYIPQPQPRCFTTSQWPYVNCKIAKASCGGCYTHLLQGGSAPSQCPNACYEDGINVGPLYRPGPYYQPSYAIPPSCDQTGCYPYTQPGMQYPPMQYPPASFNIQSMGPSFNYDPSNASEMDNNIPAPNKIKRHSKLKDVEEKEHHENHSLEVKIEEYPIKLD